MKMGNGGGQTGKSKTCLTSGGQQVSSDECKHLLAFSDSPPVSLIQSIQKLIDTAASDPANFQLALARWGQELIAAGAAEIRPPSTIAEVVQLQGLIRKAANLDTKGTTSPAAMFSPLRPIRGSVINAEQEPDEQEPDEQEPDEQEPDEQELEDFEV
jgi:hypothetical protein